MSAVSAVLIGDAHSGKSWIARRLQSLSTSLPDGARGATTNTTPDSLAYVPSIGAEMYTITSRFHRQDVSLELWDYPGNERFHAGLAAATVQCDVCCLVVDATEPDAMLHLDAWHDEYVRSTRSSVAMPAVVVALTKWDAPVERRVNSVEDVALWCRKAHVDPVLWPKEVVGGALPSPPVVTCSAIDGDGMQSLLEHILHRAILKQQCHRHAMGHFVLESTRNMQTELLKPDQIIAVVFGEVRPLPQRMFGSDGDHHRVTTDSGVIMAWLAPQPLQPGNTICCRSAHVGIINVTVGDDVSLETIRLWQEVTLREAFLRDVRSMAWVVVGWHTACRTVNSSLALSNYCLQHDMLLVEVPLSHTVAECDQSWQRIADFSRQYATNLLFERTQQQGGGVLPCPNASCSWTGRVVDIEKHLTTCDQVSVRCRWEGCSRTCTRRDREDHEASCSHRPPTCHFCGQAFHTTLYEHLLACKERTKFDETHTPCPMASLGCSSTLLQRGQLRAHVDEERVDHMNLLAAAVLRLQTDMLDQDRRHRSEMERQKELHAQQIEALRGEILITRSICEKQQVALDFVARHMDVILCERLEAQEKAARNGAERTLF